jgi:beta-glucosidase/6-phospho-beta-glucosidase/beta-galactosidase
LDLLAATRHDRLVTADYQRLQQHGIHYARDGIRWHLIESRPGKYDFSSVLPMLRAARDTGMQVIWDVCHYGYPDDIDIFKPEFVRRFANFARAFALLVLNETDDTPFVVPVNEISMWAWAGGDVAQWTPFSYGRGFELKCQLVRAAIEGIEAFRHIIPEARIVHTEPLINVLHDPAHPEQHDEAERFRMAQYQAWDMLSGRMWPQLGGNEKYLDIIGVNYYPWNQWYHRTNHTLDRSHPQYRPFRDILHEAHERYQRPMFIAETSAEGNARPDWLRYLGEETRAAIEMGLPVHGLTIYPILDYPGWEDERMCCTGLWSYCKDDGQREIYQPLADELHHQVALFDRTLAQRGMVYRQHDAPAPQEPVAQAA